MTLFSDDCSNFATRAPVCASVLWATHLAWRTYKSCLRLGVSLYQYLLHNYGRTTVPPKTLYDKSDAHVAPRPLVAFYIDVLVRSDRPQPLKGGLTAKCGPPHRVARPVADHAGPLRRPVTRRRAVQVCLDQRKNSRLPIVSVVGAS